MLTSALNAIITGIMSAENPFDTSGLRRLDIHPDDPIILAVIGVPTLGEDGIERLGGTGESMVAKALANQFGIEKIIEAGQANRGIADRIAGRKLTEEEYIHWRDSVAESGDVSNDIALDSEIIVLAESHANEIGIALVSSKFFSLFYKGFTFMLVIGVDCNDNAATIHVRKRRIIKNELEDTENNAELSKQIQDTADRRALRRTDDPTIFHKTHPDKDVRYSRRSVLDSAHVVVDNSRYKNSDEERDAFAQDIICAMVTAAPSLAPLFLKRLDAIGNSHLATRIRNLNIASNFEIFGDFVFETIMNAGALA